MERGLHKIKILRRFVSGVERLSDQTGRGLSYGVLVLIGVTLYEVIARFIFNNPTVWGHEAVELLFGVYVVLSGGYCLLHEHHVRMDILWARLSLKGKAIADLAVCGLGFLFIGTLLWCCVPFAWHSFQVCERSPSVWAPPIYPFKFILAIGVALLLLQMIVKLIRDIATVIDITLVTPKEGVTK